MKKNDLVSIPEAASIAKMGYQKLLALVKSGVIPSYRPGTKHYVSLKMVVDYKKFDDFQKFTPDEDEEQEKPATKTWVTKDIYLAAALLSVGCSVDGIDEAVDGVSYFKMSHPELDVYDLQNEHFNNKLAVHSLQFTNNFRDLKRMIHVAPRNNS